MKFHQITGAGEPSGHYTPAVSANGFVFLSGQVPSNPLSGETYGTSIEEQLTGLLGHLKTLLEDSGSSLDNVVKSNIYIPNAEHWGVVNEIYAKVFKDHKPARAIIPCGQLHKGYFVEMDVIAIQK